MVVEPIVRIGATVGGFPLHRRGGRHASMHAGRRLAAAACAMTDAAPRPPAVRILLVDDNPINQLVAREMLLSLGVAVDTADDGADALARLAHTRYALVFMDVMMPVLDGLATTQRWRAHEAAHALPRLPVIALTANAMSGDREHCLEAGMDDYLPKPVRREQLARTLARWLPPGTLQQLPPA
jgi:CheY-like chemotaxis protein